MMMMTRRRVAEVGDSHAREKETTKIMRRSMTGRKMEGEEKERMQRSLCPEHGSVR